MALPQVHIDNPPRRGVGGGRFMLDLFIIGMLINLLHIYQLFTRAMNKMKIVRAFLVDSTDFTS